METVLVMVQIGDPIPARSSHGWEFWHVFEAPKDSEHRGEWYVAWNTRKLDQDRRVHLLVDDNFLAGA